MGICKYIYPSDSSIVVKTHYSTFELASARIIGDQISQVRSPHHKTWLSR